LLGEQTVPEGHVTPALVPMQLPDAPQKVLSLGVEHARVEGRGVRGARHGARPVAADGCSRDPDDRWKNRDDDPFDALRSIAFHSTWRGLRREAASSEPRLLWVAQSRKGKTTSTAMPGRERQVRTALGHSQGNRHDI
jgi:hypothetical protein